MSSQTAGNNASDLDQWIFSFQEHSEFRYDTITGTNYPTTRVIYLIEVLIVHQLKYCHWTLWFETRANRECGLCVIKIFY